MEKAGPPLPLPPLQFFYLTPDPLAFFFFTPSLRRLPNPTWQPKHSMQEYVHSLAQNTPALQANNINYTCIL